MQLHFICIFILFFSLGGATYLNAQEIPEEVKTYIEDYYSIQADAPGEIDVNIIFDQLTYYLENPISINEVSREGLQDLYLLSPMQIDAFINYRTTFGPFHEIYELQAIERFDAETINRILPFITLEKGRNWTSMPISQLLKEAQGTFYLRYNRILEPARGFKDRGEGEGTAFEGPPGRLFTRFQYRLTKKFSVGMTAEKDPGESFFAGSNPEGFDYYSVHAFVENPTSWINRLAIGDYNLSLGQGLILHSGFGGGKSAFVTNIKRGGYSIRPHTSIAENTFMRGAALDFSINDHWSGLAFYSNRNIDGNVVFEPDTLDSGEPNLLQFTSINNSGLHRTETEINRKHTLNDRIMGGRLAYEKGPLEVRFNYFSEQFSAPLNRRDDLYNLFVPQTDHYQFYSLDYSYIGKDFHFFGETAYNGFGIATLNGLLLSPARQLQLSLLHRYFEPTYFSLNANAFSEVAQAFNEHGLYIGMNWHINGPWKLTAYADVWTHPWLRFNVDAPARGNEYLLRLEYYRKRQFDIYFQIRSKARALNQRIDGEATAEVLPLIRRQYRLHMSQNISKGFELRYRAEYLQSTHGPEETSHGYMLYGDIIYKPLGFPLSMTGRFAIFNTDDYNSRLYAYENNLLYSFSIPAYFYEGTRAYINLRWKVTRGLIWEARFARTWLNQRETIGSQWNEIEGNTRTEIATQIKLTF